MQPKLKTSQRYNSRLVTVPAGTSGNLYDRHGSSEITISRDSTYLSIENDAFGIGVIIESGEIAYFRLERVIII